MTFEYIFLLILAGLILWFLVRTIRRRPEGFSKKDISKSFFTMGILALILIAFIALCVSIL